MATQNGQYEGTAGAAMAGMQIISAVLAGRAQRSAAESANIIARANAEAQDTVRKANNQLQAAEGNFARWSQSVNNARLLRAAESAEAAATQTLARMQDARASASLNARVGAAEDQGAIAAGAAFAGVTGAAVDLIAGTAALREDMVAEQVTRTAEQEEYEQQQVQAGIISDAIAGLDSSAILSNLDFNKAIPQVQQVQGNVFLDVLGSGADFGAFGRIKKKLAPVESRTYTPVRRGTVTVGDLQQPAQAFPVQSNYIQGVSLGDL